MGSILKPDFFTVSITSVAVMSQACTVNNLSGLFVSTSHFSIPSLPFKKGVTFATQLLQLILVLNVSVFIFVYYTMQNCNRAEKLSLHNSSK